MSTVVAIDGPAGAGKSTVARLLAQKMGFSYINTGSLYRALAVAAERAHQDCGNLTPEFLNAQQLVFKGETLFLNGEATSDELRSAAAASGASRVAKQPLVREYLLPIQRKAAENGWIVMEGRDIATVVFPDAQCKFFVTASIEERARRRLRQSGEVSAGATLEKVMEEIRLRDEQDANRKVAPLKPAPDSRLVDTTGMSIEEVVALLAKLVREKM